MMTPTQIEQMVANAATQSDRYLFVVVTVVLISILIAAVYFQTKWVKDLVLAIQKQSELHASEMREDRKITNEVIKDNTVAMTRVADKLEIIR